MTSGPIPSPGRQAIRRGPVERDGLEPVGLELLAAGTDGPGSVTVELPPRQVEHVLEELLHAPGRERPAVLRAEAREQRGLAVAVAERNALRLLVIVEAAYDLEPSVDRGEELAVDARDLRAQLRDEGVACGRRFVRCAAAHRATPSPAGTARAQIPVAPSGEPGSRIPRRRPSTGTARAPRLVGPMEFRRIHDLPPYVFATVDQLKRELRRDGHDVIDLGFGNPDIPSPAVAVEKLAEAATKPVNHRYSASRGLPNLRQAICERYQTLFGVELDPERHVVTTIGAKEGLAHLM